MVENIRLSFQGIWSHKMRSFLTMLGIIIGIAAIIAIVSTIQGTNEQIKNNLVGNSNNTVEIRLQKGGQFDVGSTSAIPGVRQVSDEVCQEIQELPYVERVTRYNEREVYDGVFYKDKGLTDVYIRGVDTNYFATTGYSIRAGRNFLQQDMIRFAKVLVLEQSVASSMFQNENPIGKTIEINKVPFTIVGVVDIANKYEPTINSLEEYETYADGNTSKYIFIPKESWPILYNYDEPENVIVKAVSTDDMEKAGKKSQDILNGTIASYQTEIKYKAKNILQQAERMQQLKSSNNILLIWVASISLLVGGIGVMNIMLVSVTERTNEIGLKKAIGARKGAILAQFLTEAAVLTSMGGILGVAAGIGMAKVINRASGVAVSISVPAAVIAVLFSMIIGIVFGLFPSVRAANLDPIEALRRE